MKNLIFPLSKKEAEKAGVEYSSDINKNALFPTLLRDLRNKKGISQAKLADELCVTKSTIGLYETGDNVPDVKTLARIAEYYHVSCDYLIGKNDCKTPENEEIKKKLGLDDESIAILENAQKMKEKDFELEDKLFAINHIIETMDTSRFLKDLWMYLFAGFGFPIPDDEKRFYGATEICYAREGGNLHHTLISANELAEMYSGRVTADIVRLRDEILNKKEE